MEINVLSHAQVGLLLNIMRKNNNKNKMQFTFTEQSVVLDLQKNTGCKT